MPNDTESPDHAGLRADAQALYAKICVGDARELAIASFGITCWTAGRDSQQAELATLRARNEQLQREWTAAIDRMTDIRKQHDVLVVDNAELQKEVNALAGQVLALKEWLCVVHCDCNNDSVDFANAPAEIATEFIWHSENCNYVTRMTDLMAAVKPVEAK